MSLAGLDEASFKADYANNIKTLINAIFATLRAAGVPVESVEIQSVTFSTSRALLVAPTSQPLLRGGEAETAAQQQRFLLSTAQISFVVVTNTATISIEAGTTDMSSALTMGLLAQIQNIPNNPAFASVTGVVVELIVVPTHAPTPTPPPSPRPTKPPLPTNVIALSSLAGAIIFIGLLVYAYSHDVQPLQSLRLLLRFKKRPHKYAVAAAPGSPSSSLHSHLGDGDSVSLPWANEAFQLVDIDSDDELTIYSRGSMSLASRDTLAKAKVRAKSAGRGSKGSPDAGGYEGDRDDDLASVSTWSTGLQKDKKKKKKRAKTPRQASPREEGSLAATLDMDLDTEADQDQNGLDEDSLSSAGTGFSHASKALRGRKRAPSTSDESEDRDQQSAANGDGEDEDEADGGDDASLSSASASVGRRRVVVKIGRTNGVSKVAPVPNQAAGSDDSGGTSDDQGQGRDQGDSDSTSSVSAGRTRVRIKPGAQRGQQEDGATEQEQRTASPNIAKARAKPGSALADRPRSPTLAPEAIPEEDGLEVEAEKEKEKEKVLPSSSSPRPTSAEGEWIVDVLLPDETRSKPSPKDKDAQAQAQAQAQWKAASPAKPKPSPPKPKPEPIRVLKATRVEEGGFVRKPGVRTLHLSNRVAPTDET